MGLTTTRRKREVRLLLAMVALSVGLLAVPAVAGAATSTSLNASSNKSTITWGGNAILTAILMDTDSDTALGGQWVWVERSSTGSSASWIQFAQVTTGEGEYDTGQYTQIVSPTQKRYYRFTYPGDGTYAAAPPSQTLVIAVRPALGVPRVPTLARVSRSFTVWGTLKPHFPARARTVTLTAYRYNGRSWSRFGTYRATNVNSGEYTKYARTLKITKRGKYRFTASTAATTSGIQPIYAAARTGYSKTITIR